MNAATAERARSIRSRVHLRDSTPEGFGALPETSRRLQNKATRRNQGQADSLRILAGIRQAGIPARSILMDLPTYETWARYGTNTDKNGATIVIAKRDSVMPDGLEEHEKALFQALTDDEWERVRRIEQERIPLGVAVREVAG